MSADDVTPEKVRAWLEKATPGPWTTSPSKYVSGAYVHEDKPNGSTITHALDTSALNAALIAAAPDIAAAYLRLAAQVEAVRALHRPVNEGPPSIITWAFCSCGAQALRAMHGGFSMAPVEYDKCPTIRALAEANSRAAEPATGIPASVGPCQDAAK